MITKEDAERIVCEHVNAPDAGWPDKPEMLVTDVEERQRGWLVFWTSRLWHESRDIRHALAGNGPFLVSAADGALFEVGTAPPLQERVREAEGLLNAHLESILSG